MRSDIYTKVLNLALKTTGKIYKEIIGHTDNPGKNSGTKYGNQVNLEMTKNL